MHGWRALNAATCTCGDSAKGVRVPGDCGGHVRVEAEVQRGQARQAAAPRLREG